MSGARARPAVVALEISEKTTSVYPPAYAVDLQGRSKRALGDAFGLSQYGVNLVTLAPGTWSSQRHWHENEDEFVYVIEGEIVLIDDAGEHVLTPGMCAGFKAVFPMGIISSTVRASRQAISKSALALPARIPTIAKRT